jgi:hypothetical protein
VAGRGRNQRGKKEEVESFLWAQAGVKTEGELIGIEEGSNGGLGNHRRGFQMGEEED